VRISQERRDRRGAEEKTGSENGMEKVFGHTFTQKTLEEGIEK
jgi:hypothetical protein